MIPTANQCLQLMERYGMPPHIRAHSMVVRDVALVIARELTLSRMEISLDMVEAGALMHDIAKEQCLHTGEDHAFKGMEICRNHQLNEIAEIVGEHVVLRGFSLDKRIKEKEIVYYADKRVNHDKIVSLEDRLEYLIERYGRNRDDLCNLMRKNFELCRRVEKKIFNQLSFRPEDLMEMFE